MKIGFFTDGYLPAKHGVEASIESFRVCLEKMGHEVYIYAPHTPGFIDTNKRVIRLKSFSLNKLADMRFSFPIIHEGSLLKVLKSELDIVHIHSPFNIGFLGKIMALKNDIPSVYTHHTDYPEYAKIYLKDPLISPFLAKKLTTIFANYMDAIIAPSPKVEDLLKDYKVKKPIYVIPNGVNLSKFSGNTQTRKRSEELRRNLGISDNDQVLLSLGRVCAEKNIDFIISCFENVREKLPNIKLVVVGTGTELEKLRKYIKENHLERSVFFPGFITEEDKVAYYHMADIFLFASLTDTQGIVILEAMASGLPVIALRDGAIEAAAKNGENSMLCSPKSKKEFSEAIIELLKNNSLRSKFSKNALETADQFSEEKIALKLTDLYKRLIAEHNG